MLGSIDEVPSDTVFLFKIHVDQIDNEYDKKMLIQTSREDYLLFLQKVESMFPELASYDLYHFKVED